MNYDLYNAEGDLVYRGVSISSAVYHTRLTRQEIEWAIEEHGVCSTDDFHIVEQGQTFHVEQSEETQ